MKSKVEADGVFNVFSSHPERKTKVVKLHLEEQGSWSTKRNSSMAMGGPVEGYLVRVPCVDEKGRKSKVKCAVFVLYKEGAVKPLTKEFQAPTLAAQAMAESDDDDDDDLAEGEY